MRVLGIPILLAGVAVLRLGRPDARQLVHCVPAAPAGGRARRAWSLPVRAASGLRRRPPRPPRLRVAHECRCDSCGAGNRGPVVAEVERRGTASGGAFSASTPTTGAGSGAASLAQRAIVWRRERSLARACRTGRGLPTARRVRKRGSRSSSPPRQPQRTPRAPRALRLPRSSSRSSSSATTGR